MNEIDLYYGYFLVLLLIIAVIIIIRKRIKKDKMNRAKLKYIEQLNELIHLPNLKENVVNHTLITKLDQLKEVIFISNLNFTEYETELDERIHQLIQILYEDIKENGNLDLNNLYIHIEELMRLVLKRNKLIKSKKKR